MVNDFCEEEIAIGGLKLLSQGRRPDKLNLVALPTASLMIREEKCRGKAWALYL